MTTERIRVIFFEDGDHWLAQGLESDICVQADRLEDLYDRFDLAVRLEEQDDFERIGPAPQYFFDLWDKKAGNFTPTSVPDDKYEVGLAA